MSVTTTNTRETATVPLAILAGYEVHHSGHEQLAPMIPPSTAPINQPPNWPADHHRIPAYRPINRSLDQSQRPPGANNLERVIITVMLHGVWLNAAVSRVWRFTGGRLNDRLFHYGIGGEW
ncbi:uncharacterized protein N7479_010942 [Penicillium vulpinum]|uniref:Uncharacterized protein n=1 Tax=Penicillium vulpinum TaxID=29845 RepID=A0A1V6S013_9EURO|nr:uncharacterized protein N7479_010942 [Penicillium vulpinum]KAJ5952529.1 hypothetical protein N7479_010942 [Penicillium vulpinum]OQE07208.1 hypothetical protein PENVUL_c014G07569 [Penicillium vulpinum]